MDILTALAVSLMTYVQYPGPTWGGRDIGLELPRTERRKLFSDICSWLQKGRAAKGYIQVERETGKTMPQGS